MHALLLVYCLVGLWLLSERLYLIVLMLLLLIFYWWFNCCLLLYGLVFVLLL